MSASETRFAALLFSDIVGSTDLKSLHGVPAFREALMVHNGHFERIVRECRGVRILQNMGDGYFAEAGSVAEAVRFALLFQAAMRAGPWVGVPLTARVGIHAGEVATLNTEGGSVVVAPAADLSARVMALALGGQILLTRFPFDEARHFLREHPAVEGQTMPPLRWLAHGPYLLKGRDEPMEIFEVGAEGLAPLVPPPDGEKAKRVIRPGEEETLGWRPASGLEVPGRVGWMLGEKIGEGGFGEVWLAEQAKTKQRRVFKFCFDEERLRSFKRELTFFRLIRDALGDRPDIARLYDVKLDEPPFFLESEYAERGNLVEWCAKQGGADAVPMARRIEIIAQIAEAVAAAHSVGILHKDLKPQNVLMQARPGGGEGPQITDFGIGALADKAALSEMGITAAGFTVEKNHFVHKSLSNWAANIAVGCSHACTFCYVPSVSTIKQRPHLAKYGVNDPDAQWGDYVILRPWDEKKFRQSVARAQKIKRSALERDGNRAVIYCSTTDPYQMFPKAAGEKRKLLFDASRSMVCRSLEIIRDESDLNVRILTRSPLAEKDFRLFKSFRERLLFGMSLPTLNDELRKPFEPKAPGVQSRLETLKEAKRQGLHVYVAVAPTYPGCDEKDLRATLTAVRDLKPVTIFHEPINRRAENVKRIEAYAKEKGLTVNTEPLQTEPSWYIYAVDQLFLVERIARELGIEKQLKLWPDADLGSESKFVAAREYQYQEARKESGSRSREGLHALHAREMQFRAEFLPFKKWLDGWWDRISDWPK